MQQIPLPEFEQVDMVPIFNVNLNLNVDFVTIREQVMPNFGVPAGMGNIVQSNKPAPDVYRLWAKHFSPLVHTQQVVDIPRDWASFFIVMFLSPRNFEWAKTFLGSKTWESLLSCSKGTEMMTFAWPKDCPKDAEVVCLEEGPTEQAQSDE